MGWFKVAQVIGSKGGKKISETITSVKGKYNVGSADKIKKKGKEFKEKIAGDERKEAMTRYFTNQPPKNPKKKVDEDLF